MTIYDFRTKKRYALSRYQGFTDWLKRFLAVRESLDSKNLFDSNSFTLLEKPPMVWRAAIRQTLVRMKILFH